MNVDLDTNIVIYELAGKLTQPLPAGPYAVSVITEMELLSFPMIDALEAAHISTYRGPETNHPSKQNIPPVTSNTCGKGIAPLQQAGAGHCGQLDRHDIPRPAPPPGPNSDV